VNTGPVFVAILAPTIIRERVSRRDLVSAAIAVSGIGFATLWTGSSGRWSLTGDLLALLAAALASFYTIIGRELRSRINATRYILLVYLSATVPLFPLALSMESLTVSSKYSETDMLAILGLVLIPTILGHGLYNYSLRYVKAMTANVFALLEPVIASLLGLMLFGEEPTRVQVIGYALIVLALFNLGRSRPR